MGKQTFVTIISLLSLFLCGYILASSRQKKIPEQSLQREEISNILLSQITSFRQHISDTLLPLSENIGDDTIALQTAFIHSRKLYKKFEWAAEYFTGSTAQLINGPPVPEVDNADLLDPVMARAIDPSGLQVIAEFLFPEVDFSRKNELINQLRQLKSNIDFIETHFNNFSLPDWRILDAVKLEVFRVLTLGITGFDTPLTLRGIDESATVFASMKQVLHSYTRFKKGKDIDNLLEKAIQYLQQYNDFNSFDRAHFITEFGNPVSRLITQIQDQYGYPLKYNRMLRQEAASLFDSGVFNVNAFAPGQEYFMTREKTALGEKLFFDTHLSGTNTRSCGSCHLPEKGFADGLTKNTALHDPRRLLPRNSPTLSYAALQSNQFYDMRALTLEDQANTVIHNPDEMDGSFADILTYLQNNDDYKEFFENAFPEKKIQNIDSSDVLNALAAYIRSLTKFNSRFDQFMRGDQSALNPREISGFNLFMGKAKCATCHFMPVFNGIAPPKYTMTDAEIIGVPLSVTDSVIDPDPGWYDITGISFFKHAFKTPGIRNIAETAPYMHNGIYATLEEVMDFYNNGGGAGMGIQLPNQTLSEDSLHLSDREIADVIAFMKSLNDQ